MIHASDLTKLFTVDKKTKKAVDSVSFDIDSEEIFVLLGPNGAGKTTIVRMLSGLIPITKGSASIAGFDVRVNPIIVRKHIGLMTERAGLYKALSARKNLEFFAKSYGLKNTNLTKKINEYAEMMYLENSLDSPISTFSKGMIQKVSIIKTLLHEPKVLFLDEPTSALDPKIAKSMRDLILSLRDEKSMTVMVTTHNLLEAEYLADKIGILKNGKLIRFDEKVHFKNGGDKFLQISFVSNQINSLATIKEIITTISPIKQLSYDESKNELVMQVDKLDANQSAEINKTLILKGFLISEFYLINESLEGVYLSEIDKEE